jgi:enoyl reductase-like protein
MEHLIKAVIASLGLDVDEMKAHALKLQATLEAFCAQQDRIAARQEEIIARLDNLELLLRPAGDYNQATDPYLLERLTNGG